MSAISTCPKCNQQITIPDGVDPASIVRCPLCEAEFLLSDALAACPPSLIPVVEVADDTDTDDNETSEATDANSAFAFGLFDDDTTANDEQSTEEEQPSESEESESDVEQEESEAETGDGGEFNFGGGADDGMDKIERMRQRQKKSGTGRSVIGYVLGGVLGVGIAIGLLQVINASGFQRLIQKYFGSAATVEVIDEPEVDIGDAPWRTAAPAEKKKVAKKANKKTNTVKKQSAPTSSAKAIKQPPKKKELPADYVGPKDPPSFTSEELGTILKEVALELKKSGDSKPMSTVAYRKLSRLAETVAYVDGSGNGELGEKKQYAQTLIEGIVANRANLNKIKNMSRIYLLNFLRNHAGITLTGDVQAIAKQNGLYGAKVSVEGQKTAMSVLSRTPFPFAKGDKVVILGCIVNNPAKNIVGYGGKQSRLIWFAMGAKIPSK